MAHSTLCGSEFSTLHSDVLTRVSAAFVILHAWVVSDVIGCGEVSGSHDDIVKCSEEPISLFGSLRDDVELGSLGVVCHLNNATVEGDIDVALGRPSLEIIEHDRTRRVRGDGVTEVLKKAVLWQLKHLVQSVGLVVLVHGLMNVVTDSIIPRPQAADLGAPFVTGHIQTSLAEGTHLCNSCRTSANHEHLWGNSC